MRAFPQGAGVFSTTSGFRPTTSFRNSAYLRDIVFEADEQLHARIFKLFSTNHSPESSAGTLRDLLCCLPRVAAPPGIDYRNVFRVIVMQFIDAWGFDVRSVKKSCVHIAHPDGKRIVPFDTYNLFYRDGLEESVLGPLRREREHRETARRPTSFCAAMAATGGRLRELCS